MSFNKAGKTEYDAVIIGSGPNGLAAAILCASQGLSVLLVEGRDTIGGGARSAELTLPGFTHDVCSAIHPLAVTSPFFKQLHLEKFGLEWRFPPASLAHPQENYRSALVYPSLDETADDLGKDRRSYLQLMQPLLEDWGRLSVDLLGALRIPRHLLALARFGLLALNSAAGLAQRRFKTDAAKALFAGMAGHAMLPLTSFASASFGLVLSLSAHAVGWPLAVGGSQSIINALGGCLRELGGQIQTGWYVRRLEELPASHVVLLDISPRQLLDLAGEKLSALYRRQLSRYRYGQGVFKVDWALDGPIPWRDKRIHQSATVHLGETLEEISRSESQVWQGKHPEKPYVLLSQPTLFDPSRAPQGKHTAWAYCHVPAGSQTDMRSRIEAQIERYAPGFCERILGFHCINAAEYEVYNPNYIGGDINSGVQDLRQFFTRPVMRWNPYSTPLKGVYLCSASTPPGGGVHGMCGYLAAKSALQREFGLHVERV